MSDGNSLHTTGWLALLSYLFEMYLSQSGYLMPLHSVRDFNRAEVTFGRIRYLLEAAAPVKLPT